MRYRVTGTHHAWNNDTFTHEDRPLALFIRAPHAYAAERDALKIWKAQQIHADAVSVHGIPESTPEELEHYQNGFLSAWEDTQHSLARILTAYHHLTTADTFKAIEQARADLARLADTLTKTETRT